MFLLRHNFMNKKRSLFLQLLKITLGFLVVIILLFVGFLILMSCLDYKPKEIENVENFGATQTMSIQKTSFSLLTWNIGYGGLGKESDFFFDGGIGVRQSEEITQKNETGISNFLVENDSIDFVLLQEVDKDSRRTYHKDQTALFKEKLSHKSALFAVNYNCAFVPQPIGNPYGKCYAGIMSLSNFNNSNNQRVALAADASWPLGLFMLDRCLLKSSYPLQNGKELIIINMHLSAYDDGTVKQEQMDKLKEIILEEFHKGNYVIVGGDWNQYPPMYEIPVMKQKDAIAQIKIDENYPEKGWNWGVDVNVPTNRKLESPYNPELSDKIVIDFFLTSPNIEIQSVKGVNLDFEYSDHQPVIMNVSLK